jgi:CARDB protein
MAFSDDDPPYAPRRAPSPHRGPAERQRQIMARRGVAVVIGVVVLILIVIGVRGCLNARKTRSFENFVADLRTLVAQTDQLSKGFFQHLESPSGSKLTFQTELRTDAGTASSLLTRAEQLSTPGELTAAQSDLVLAYQFRSNALAGVANELAGPKPGAKTADHVVAYMKQLLASDVIYERAEAEIDQGLSDQGIDEKAPPSVFLPDDLKWLDPTRVSAVLAGIGVSSGGGNVSGVHGTGIASATLNGATLTAGLAATVTSAAPNALVIGVANQGQSTEQDIEVSVKVSGAGANISKTKTIPSVAAGATGTATVDLGSPPTGSPLTIKVSVAPVVGERITTNNHETYPVTFQ